MSDGLRDRDDERAQPGPALCIAMGLRRLPIVALTATTTESDVQACLAVGMDAVVGKPFTPERLAEALRGAAAGSMA